MLATEMQEGIVIRCIQRVAEITESLKRAFANIHCDKISAQFGRLGNLIRRDIAFLPSLYTNKDFMLSGIDTEADIKPEEELLFEYDFGDGEESESDQESEDSCS